MSDAGLQLLSLQETGASHELVRAPITTTTMLRRSDAQGARGPGNAAVGGRERPNAERGVKVSTEEEARPECPDWNTYVGRLFAHGCEPRSCSSPPCARPLPPPAGPPRPDSAAPALEPCTVHRYMSDVYIQAVVERNLCKILVMLLLCILVLLGSVRSFLRRSLRRRCVGHLHAVPCGESSAGRAQSSSSLR